MKKKRRWFWLGGLVLIGLLSLTHNFFLHFDPSFEKIMGGEPPSFFERLWKMIVTHYRG